MRGYEPLCMGHVLLSTGTYNAPINIIPHQPPPGQVTGITGVLIEEAAPIVGHLISY